MSERRERRQLAAVWALYVFVVVAGQIAVDAFDLGTTGVAVVVGACIACALLGMGLVIRAVTRSKELERFMSLQSTSLAFFTTMLFALTYALIESWVEVPDLSMWVVWTVGMGSWAAYSIILGRRFS